MIALMSLVHTLERSFPMCRDPGLRRVVPRAGRADESIIIAAGSAHGCRGAARHVARPESPLPRIPGHKRRAQLKAWRILSWLTVDYAPIDMLIRGES